MCDVSVRGGLVAPVDRQPRASERHEHHGDCGGHRHERVREVRLGQQESQSCALHACIVQHTPLSGMPLQLPIIEGSTCTVIPSGGLQLSTLPS